MKVLILFAGFILANVLVFKTIKLTSGGSRLIAWLLFLTGYYFLIRKLIFWAVFPGSFCLFKRNLEVGFQRNMGKQILNIV